MPHATQRLRYWQAPTSTATAASTSDDIQAIASSYSSAPPAAIDTGFASAALIIAPEDFVPTATWTVNTTSDAPDANVGNGVCATAAGQCSLRAAIENANVHSGNDLINFNIPGTGVQTIELTDRLPNHQ